jgi:hypothetical protein
MGFGSKRLKAKKLTSLQAVSEVIWRTTSTRAYSVNPEPKLAQARHNATTPGMRLVSLAQLSRTCATAMLMRDIGAMLMLRL